MKLRCSEDGCSSHLPIPAREAGCRFKKATRSEPGPTLPTAQGTLGIYRYLDIAEMPALLPIIFGLSCTTIASRTNTRIEYQSSPSSTALFKCMMHRSADACQSIETPCRPGASGLGNPPATQSIRGGRLRFPNTHFVHGAPRRSAGDRYQGIKSSLAASRACFLPPCRAELHRSASDTASLLLRTSLD